MKTPPGLKRGEVASIPDRSLLPPESVVPTFVVASTVALLWASPWRLQQQPSGMAHDGTDTERQLDAEVS